MARFFLPTKNIEGKRGLIEGQEFDHLRRVLRLKVGDPITLFDDSGREHEAVIRALGLGQGEVEILRSYDADKESALHITLALGLTKGEKMDFVVEKSTELGVQRIVPFASRFAVPKLDEKKIARRTERWQKIALSAAKQCGRTCVPEILPLCEYQQLIQQPRPDTVKLLFWEREATQSLMQLHEHQREAKAVLLAIGPEGGFSDDEARLAVTHGFHSVQLGRRILRAETAAVAALSLAQFLWGDLR
jgi:16S rRNA (uracil1498-N3)-methyltransferase